MVNNINIDDNAKEPTNLAENQPINPYDPVSEEGVLGLLVEMEYERDKNVFDEKLKAMTLYHIYTLVSKWIENEKIEGMGRLKKVPHFLEAPRLGNTSEKAKRKEKNSCNIYCIILYIYVDGNIGNLKLPVKPRNYR